MRDPARTVVVTGAGVLCHLGDDLARIEGALREGRGLPFVRHPPAVEAGSRCQLLGSYRGELAADKRLARFMGRAALMGYRAALDALAQSGLERRDIAVVAGSGTGDVMTHIDVERHLARGGRPRVSATVIPRMMASTVAANLATALRTTGPSFSATAACSGGAYNILLAAELIEHGHVDAALAGGVEVADAHFHAGFDAMRAFNGEDNEHPERASRPYARDRAGFIFGEGAGMVVLETKAAAEARGAPVLGIVAGYGMSSDGTGDMVCPTADGALSAMERALRHAGIGADAIDYVHTHGTSTVLGDVSEVRALRRLFGARRVPYSSTKGYIGHTISAAGAINAIFTLSMLRGGWIAPSINAEPLDPELIDYPPVVRPTARPTRLALSNSFGFGGTNVSMVLARAG
ncbi:MAG: beta-ketoacyl-[acyl-carrier-protein] synthase family protein [Myxococcales bacterium]